MLYFLLKQQKSPAVDLSALRDEMAPDAQGVSAARLADVAAAHGLPLRGVRMKPIGLRTCGKPCVLHVNGNHFIAFVGYDGQRVVVFDNRFGLVDGTTSWFEKKYVWAGFALVPEAEDTEPSGWWPAALVGVAAGGVVVGLRARGHTPRPAPQAAFTLIELLVVVAILGVLVGLTLGAVQRVRSSAARAACANNLRQIALALHHYHDARGALPAGVTYQDDKHPQPFMGWSCRLLPYIDQGTLWEGAERAFAADRRFTHNPPHTGLATRVATYSCPADDRTSEVFAYKSTRVALTSYLGVEGTNQYRSDGMIYLDSRVRLSDVTDGVANTLLVGERPPSHDGTLGWWYAGEGLERDGAADLTLGALEKNMPRRDGCPVGPYEYGPGRVDRPCDAFHFWSLHPGGANFALADGSVRFLAYAAAPVLPALATRAGGEAVGEP